tara:strand:- start:321 stop:572 length:252 start_codon:yes stop_codon:yes gene_type:complete
MIRYQQAYKKAEKVIETCVTPDHVTAAKRYVDFFFTTYSTPAKADWPHRLYDKTAYWDTPQAVAQCYDTLLYKLITKKKEITT